MPYACSEEISVRACNLLNGADAVWRLVGHHAQNCLYRIIRSAPGGPIRNAELIRITVEVIGREDLHLTKRDSVEHSSKVRTIVTTEELLKK